MHHFLWHLDASYHVTIVLHSEIPRAIHISLIFCHGILGGFLKGSDFLGRRIQSGEIRGAGPYSFSGRKKKPL